MTVQSLNGGPYRNVVSESEFYKLAMRCQDRPVARQFQDWVTREVLPAIRRDGGYVAGEAQRPITPAPEVRAGAPKAALRLRRRAAPSITARPPAIIPRSINSVWP